MSNNHIIVVEDEEQTRFSLSLILKKAGYKVTTAIDGLCAYNKIIETKDSHSPIDFLLTDIQLPNMTGLELIERLGAENLTLPTLVITGHGDKNMVIELMRIGCNEYIDKPFDPDVLLTRVEAVFTKIIKSEIAKKKKSAEIVGEKLKLNQMIESYKNNFDLLKDQVSLAVDSYKNLIQVKSEGYKVQIAVRYKHLVDLGGDFIDVKDSLNGSDILVADVAGHDLGASYHTVMVKAFFDENSRSGNDGKSFFKLLNKYLTENCNNDRMITANYLSLNLKNMRAEIVAAAHPPLIVVDKANSPRMLNLEGDILGIHNDVSFGTHSFDIKSGDRMFLYTDGIIDASRLDVVSGKRKKLRVEGLKALIQKHYHLSLNDMINSIWDDIYGFCGKKPSDDILIMGLEIP